jgi:hypothetical protein
MDVTDIVLAAVTGGVVIICCIGTIVASVCCVRKYALLRQLPVHRQRLSTEDELIT